MEALDFDFPFLAELSDTERHHFRTLRLIRPQIPSEGQLNLLEGYARSLASPRLLTLIARTPHWLLHGPILLALSENEATPESIRRDLELAVSIFDLMRELDKCPPEEKEERSQTLKEVYHQLRPELKPIVKQQAKQLARQVQPTGTTLDLPPLPSDDEDWEALTEPPAEEGRPPLPAAPLIGLEAMLERAATTHQPDELAELLIHSDLNLQLAALRNPQITEELLVASLPKGPNPEFFDEVYHEARWYFRETIRRAIQESPASSHALSRRIALAEQLLAHLIRGATDPRSLRRIVSLFTQLDEGEFQFITYWAKHHAPQLLRVVKFFYDRLQRRRSSLASGLPSQPDQGRWASLEERVFTANQATAPDQLVASLLDPDPTVFAIVLENPGLMPREILSAIPRLDTARLQKLAAHRSWGENGAIREALLHNPQIPEVTALRLLEGLSSPRVLLDLLRNARIPHMELKRRAQETLRVSYLAMDVQGRILALRSTGGELIRYLPLEVLKDEKTLRQLVSDRQLDPSLLLRLTRNKQTPRSVLELISTHPTLMAHPPIMSELLLNPKTPREAAARVWGLLSESEQEELLASPHLPAPLRHLA